MNAREAAVQAKEAIHALNYATLPWDNYPGLEYPSDAYDAVGSLVAMAGMLPQALNQLGKYVDRETAAGRIEIYEETVTPEAAAATLDLALADAQSAAVDLLRALNRAHSATSRMAYCGPERDA